MFEDTAAAWNFWTARETSNEWEGTHGLHQAISAVGLIEFEYWSRLSSITTQLPGQWFELTVLPPVVHWTLALSPPAVISYYCPWLPSRRVGTVGSDQPPGRGHRYMAVCTLSSFAYFWLYMAWGRVDISRSLLFPYSKHLLCCTVVFCLHFWPPSGLWGPEKQRLQMHLCDPSTKSCAWHLVGVQQHLLERWMKSRRTVPSLTHPNHPPFPAVPFVIIFWIPVCNTTIHPINKTRNGGVILTLSPSSRHTHQSPVPADCFSPDSSQICSLSFSSLSPPPSSLPHCYNYLVFPPSLWPPLICPVTPLLWPCHYLSKVIERLHLPTVRNSSFLARPAKPFLGLASACPCIHSSDHLLPWDLCYSVTRFLVVTHMSHTISCLECPSCSCLFHSHSYCETQHIHHLIWKASSDLIYPMKGREGGRRKG